MAREDYPYLRFLRDQGYSLRGLSRSLGIPYSTLQYYSTHQTIGKWIQPIREKFSEEMKSYLELKHWVPPRDAESIAKGTWAEVQRDIGRWIRIQEKVGDIRWQEYQERYKQILDRWSAGKKLTIPEKKVLDAGLTQAVKRRVRRQAKVNLYYSKRTFGALWEIYG